MTKLTDLCDIQYGYAFDSGAFTNDNSYPQLVRIRDVKRGYSETFYNGDYPDEYVLSAGDLLIGMDGEFNIARWKIDGALLNQRVCKIVAKDNTDEEFLRFALSKALKVIEDRTSFVTVKHLSARELNKLEIQVPSYDEQKKISDILHRLERIIDARQNELKSLDILIKARFVELFGDPVQNPKGWDMPLIEDIVANEKNALKAGPFGSALKKEYYVESGYKIYGQEQVISGDHTFGDYYIDEERYKSLENCAVQAGDVLISLVGTYGKLLIMPEIFEPGIINPRLMKITFDKEKVNPYYFQFFFQSESLKRALSDSTHGGTMDILNLGIVRKIAMPLPPIELQNEFVAFVKQVDKSKVAIQKSLAETQLLFDKLMQDYFG